MADDAGGWRRRDVLATGARAAAAAALLGHDRARAAEYRATAAPARPRSLDGRGNNPWRADWGRAGAPYRRVARANYADGIGAMAPGPNPRFISNRIFNSLGVDVFSPRNVSQLVWAWGQAIDHTIGLAQAGEERADIPLSTSDPLESFPFDVPAIPFTRDAPAPGTGHTSGHPRRRLNTVSAFLDASSVYGTTRARLGWLRAGGDAPGHLAAELLLPGRHLPSTGARGDAARAPDMQRLGRLAHNIAGAVVAGDVRANENLALTALQTVFAREHNRIVARLPARLAPEERFQIARRVVGATLQHITFHEFLPAVGVELPPYRGYRPHVRPDVEDAFAAVGFRCHSMVNGEVHLQLGDGVVRTVSQSEAFFNPGLLRALGVGTVLRGLALEPGYRNDEQIDDALRSILFEIPGAGRRAIVDLGAIDIQRGRDAGMPGLNDLRVALGLRPHRSFTELTGEATDRFAGRFGSDPINHPGVLRFAALWDVHGQPLPPAGTTGRAAYTLRASTLAARLRAIYGHVDRVEAFVGMVCEPQLRGSELGETQHALWRRQFTALRDGDRYCALADPQLAAIWRAHGIDHRCTLSQLIARNTDVRVAELPQNAFFAP